MQSECCLPLQLKTESKRREQELADLERQDASLSAQVEESKRGKEDSVSAEQHPSPHVALSDTLQSLG